MKTILQTKLTPTIEQHQLLLQTMAAFNGACDYISEIALAENCFSKFTLQKLVYYDVKEQFGLSAQVTILAIRKVVDSYKFNNAEKKLFAEAKKNGTEFSRIKRTFDPTSAIIYDQRVMSFKGPNRVSLWTIEGRQLINFLYGDYQKSRWHQRKGQADLVFRKGVFYLLISVETEEAPIQDPDGFIGVDLGVVQIATDSDGETFSGSKVESVRVKNAKLKKDLQARGSKSAKRHLQRTRKRESNFKRDVNHCISKYFVEKAKRTNRGIAVENLTGIRLGIRARKSQRSQLSGWAFSQLRQFIEYKAKLNGVAVAVVKPQYTSQCCSTCGHVNKNNRQSQAEFVCCKCGHSENADVNAAKNLALLAEVNQRIVGAEITKGTLPIALSLEATYKPQPLGWGS